MLVFSRYKRTVQYNVQISTIVYKVMVLLEK